MGNKLGSLPPNLKRKTSNDHSNAGSGLSGDVEDGEFENMNRRKNRKHLTVALVKLFEVSFCFQ